MIRLATFASLVLLAAAPLAACGGSENTYRVPTDTALKPFTPPEADDEVEADDDDESAAAAAAAAPASAAPQPAAAPAPTAAPPAPSAPKKSKH
jgi:hypothetical protein